MRKFLAFRVKLALFMLALGGLITGARGVYIAVTNRTPTVLGYRQCLKSRPDKAWLRVTNCELDVPEARWFTRVGDEGDDSLNRATTFYVPVREPDSPKGEVCMLVKTTDPGIKQTLIEGNTVSLKSIDAGKEWILKNLKRVYPRQDVQGIVMWSWDLSSTERAELAKAQKNLADDFLIIDADRQKPSFLISGVSLVAGLAFLGIVGFSALSTGEEQRVVAKKPLPVPKVYVPPTHCRMCQAPVVARGTDAPRTCEQCGADLTRR